MVMAVARYLWGRSRGRSPVHGGCHKQKPTCDRWRHSRSARQHAPVSGGQRAGRRHFSRVPSRCPARSPTGLGPRPRSPPRHPVNGLRVIRRVRSARSPGGLGCPSSRPCLRVRGCPRSRPMSAGWRATASEINFLTALCLQHMLCRRRAIGMVADVVTAVLERAPFPMPWRFAWARYVRGQ